MTTPKACTITVEHFEFPGSAIRSKEEYSDAHVVVKDNCAIILEKDTKRTTLYPLGLIYRIVEVEPEESKIVTDLSK